VCYSLEEAKTLQRETRALQHFSEQLHKPGVILTANAQPSADDAVETAVQTWLLR
jgi:hypothetical protein